jgi:hypothetical protein
MFPYLAGSVNNDTLAYLGTGLYFFGLSRWHGSGERDRTATAAIFAGLCITLLTKATASAFVVVFSIAYLVPYTTQLPSRLRADRRGAIVLAVALAICASFYLYALLEFGSLMPKPQPLRPSTPPAEPLSVLAYAGRYATTMWNRLPVIVSHLSLDPFVPRGHVFFYAMAIAPVLAWAVARATAARNGITTTLRHASDAFMFACMGTLALHFLQAYLGYRDTGLFGGLQPRYLFAMLPGLWLMPFVLRPTRWLRTVYTATLCISAMFAFWSSVPFFLGKQSDLARASAPALRPPPVHAASSAKLLEGGRGHVDVLKLSGKGLRVRGWAYHPNASTPVSRVLVFAGDKMIAALQLRVARPDVARRMGDGATRSGFAADIPIAESSRECEIQVAAQGPDDRVFWIRRASCQP